MLRRQSTDELSCERTGSLAKDERASEEAAQCRSSANKLVRTLISAVCSFARSATSARSTTRSADACAAGSAAILPSIVRVAPGWSIGWSRHAPAAEPTHGGERRTLHAPVWRSPSPWRESSWNFSSSCLTRQRKQPTRSPSKSYTPTKAAIPPRRQDSTPPGSESSRRFLSHKCGSFSPPWPDGWSMLAVGVLLERL